MNFLNEKFHEKFELVLLLTGSMEPMDLAIVVLDSNVDGTAFRIEEGYDGFQENPFVLRVLYREGEIFVFDS